MESRDWSSDVCSSDMYTSVREEDISLFGFGTKEELAFYKMLISVNGIGPKSALGILGAFAPTDLKFAIISSDVKTLSKAPGIGKKTAERMILDLRDKIEFYPLYIEKKWTLRAESAFTFVSFVRCCCETIK